MRKSNNNDKWYDNIIEYRGLCRYYLIYIYVWCVCDITNNMHVLLRNTNKAHECFAYDIIFRYYLKR